MARTFLTQEENSDFDRYLATPGAGDWLEYVGFIGAEAKATLLREADLFCFPTYYANEGQPVNLIEAMAFGLPVVVTRWCSLPEFIPDGYAGLIEPRQPGQVAAALLALVAESGHVFREIFLRHLTLEQYLASLAAAVRSVDEE